MANSLTRDLQIYFDKVLDSFELNAVVSKEADRFVPDSTEMQRAGDTYYRPMPYMLDAVQGLDLTAATANDLIQMQVPATISQLTNVIWNLDAKEMRDEWHMDQAAKAAGRRLVSEVDTFSSNLISTQGSLVVKQTGAMAWDSIATAERIMLEQGVGANYSRSSFLNPKDYLPVAKELGFRQYMQGNNPTQAAYEKSQLPDVAGFRTFRTEQALTIVANANTGIATGASSQSYTPISTYTTGSQLNQPADNRFMTLVLATGSGAKVKAGDAITIAGVNSVHQITKTDTGSLKTFRVISVTGDNAVITPPVIATGPYRNVTAAAAAGAAIVPLNTATSQANPFWREGSLEIIAGKLAVPTNQGVQVMSGTTEQGIPIIMMYKFDPVTAKTYVRFNSFFGAVVKNTEMCGIILANQT